MKITIPGPPIPKARARSFRSRGKTITYDPQHDKKQAVRKHLIAEWAKQYRNESEEIAKKAANFACARSYHLSICFYMPIPDSESEGQKNAKLWGIDPCNKKPDCSNMLKFYEDAANEVLYQDDSMIVSGDFKKKYDKNPRTEITIMAIEEKKLDKKAELVLKSISPDKWEAFVRDLRTLFKYIEGEVHDCIENNQLSSLSNSALLVKDFADTYAKDLMKIAKIKDE